MKKKRRVKKKIKKVFILIFFLLLLLFILFVGLNFFFKKTNVALLDKPVDAYLSSIEEKVKTVDEEFNESDEIYRGEKVQKFKKKIVKEETEEEFIKIKYKNKTYYVKEDNISLKEQESIKEDKIYVRTPLVLYKEKDDISILTSIKKGEELSVLGFDKIDKGKVNKYYVSYNDKKGYVYSKYTLQNSEQANLPYDQDGIYKVHETRTDKYGGGSAANLDYYPEDKIKIDGNEMPTEAKTLYINAAAIKDVDSYIKIAKDSGINAFVVDIKDNTAPGYDAETFKELSETNYNKALNKKEDYKSYIKKLKDEGFYVIGRITAFKDNYYATDHKENSILDTRTGNQFVHNHSYWPSAFKREVWEFNVRLAIESVKDIGFNEIQFDYVRFPDKTGSLEKQGIMDMRNEYKEEKAQALQQFLMYARDEIHEVGAYVSADVFGESANNYVTAYGQYWPAISNVVDVISAMPYPDHFNMYEYGFKVPVWTIPYELMKKWGETAKARQDEIKSPAIARTWIQAYNTIRSPYITYDATKIEEQIKGLYESGLDGGYITWNSGSSIDKYNTLKPAFRKELKNG